MPDFNQNDRFSLEKRSFVLCLAVFPTARLCFCVARILPLILFSYHSFLRFSVNFLSHSHFVKFDIKICRNRVLFSILSHNLSHKRPFLPLLLLITEAFFMGVFLFNRQAFSPLSRGTRQRGRYMYLQVRQGRDLHTF